MKQQPLASGVTGAPPTDLVAANGKFSLISNPTVHAAYTDVLKQHKLPQLDVTLESKSGPEKEPYSSKSFCANFVEVRMHALTGEVRVSRVVSVLDVGRVLNHKTARSQVLGSVV